MVHDRRGEADARLEVLDRLEKRLRRVLLHEDRRSAVAHRKAQHPPEPEGERKRRRAAEDVVLVHLEHRARKQSHMAITSRWKCIVPFGLPVVPEVKAISATSSAAVAALVNHSGCLSASSSSESGPSSCQ